MRDAPATSTPPLELQGSVADGAWHFQEGDGAASAGFGLPESEIQFSIHCARAARVVTLGTEHELSPDQDTTLTLRTAAGAYDFPARSFNEGLPTVSATITVPAHSSNFGGDERLAALARANDRFAVSVGGVSLLMPAHGDIRRVLALCGVAP